MTKRTRRYLRSAQRKSPDLLADEQLRRDLDADAELDNTWFRGRLTPAPLKRLTRKEAQRQINELGLTMRTTDGEHRVAYRVMSAAEAERKAYYTGDLEDAVATAIEMANWMARHGKN